MLMPLREDVIHFAVRGFLREKGWVLLAGQYPNGSDDELQPLNVVDPAVACDGSPDSRRHSQNKLVPDLVAISEPYLLVMEMKPAYDLGDVLKLRELLGVRRQDFCRALTELVARRNLEVGGPVDRLVAIPALGFTEGCGTAPADQCCLLVRPDMAVTPSGPWTVVLGCL